MVVPGFPFRCFSSRVPAVVFPAEAGANADQEFEGTILWFCSELVVELFADFLWEPGYGVFPGLQVGLYLLPKEDEAFADVAVDDGVEVRGKFFGRPTPPYERFP